MFFKNKKGLELSINFIVVIILSLVILSMGILIIRNFFTQAVNLQTEVEEATERELENLIMQGEIVSIPIHKKNVQRGEVVFYNLYVLNVIGQKSTFNIDIAFKLAVDPLQQEIPLELDPNAWVYSKESVVLDNNQAKKSQIGVNVPKNAPKGLYIFDAVVSSGGEQWITKMYVNIV